jgi:hypothetical protein
MLVGIYGVVPDRLANTDIIVPAWRRVILVEIGL